MAQVLRNLLCNAIKFTPIEGTVEVAINARDDRLEVKVRDSGVGISIENQTRLFSEGVQFCAKAQQAGGGSGLGLWISRKIMELHGGCIAVQSEGEGRGTVFVISLPMQKADDFNPSEGEARPVERVFPMNKQLSAFRKTGSGLVKNYSSKIMGGQLSTLPLLHILVVDDSALNRKMLSRGFVKEGFSVVEADDGDTAIEVCSRVMNEGKAFDLITMDNVCLCKLLVLCEVI